MASFAPSVYPVPNRFIDLGKEAAGQPGSIAAATYTFPLTQFKPVDKYTMLPDSAWRNAMGDLYNYIQGVRIADISMGGPFFADGIGYVLANVLGDYYQGINQGTVAAQSWVFTASNTTGSGTLVVSNASSFTTGEVISVGGTSTTSCEVRKITNVTGTSPGTLTLNNALYYAHPAGSVSTSGTVIAWSGYTSINHTFALLNNGLGAGGWTASQPPTYTWYDYSGVPATSGARQYGYACFSDISITSDATKLVMWEGKMQALASTIASATPGVDLSTVAPQAAWRATVNLAGAGTQNVSEWKFTLTRKLAAKYTNSNQQDFFALPRGYLSAALSLTIDPASDESEFNYYLLNSQPTAVLTATNGLSGSAAASLTISANQVGFDTGELVDSREVFGFDLNSKLVDNTTDIGPSGGFGPCLVTLANSVINY